MSTGEQTGATSVAEAIRRMRAVRAYTTESVPEPIIDAILNAGWRAQSSKNSQPWIFILISDRAQLQRLSAAGTYAAHLANAACLWFWSLWLVPSLTLGSGGLYAAGRHCRWCRLMYHDTPRPSGHPHDPRGAR